MNKYNIFSFLDPRVRLFIFLFIVGSTIMVNTTLQLSIITFLIILGCKIIRLSWKKIITTFKISGLLLICILIPCIWQWGVYKGIFIIIKMICLIFTGVLMMSVLPDKMLIYSLEWLLSPLKKVGFPVRDILMIGIMAYEFVPVVSEELRFVMKSKELLIYPRRRLLHPEILSMKIIIPLFSRSFERVEKLAKGIHIDNSIGAMKLKDYIVIVLSGMIFIWIVFFVS